MKFAEALDAISFENSLALNVIVKDFTLFTLMCNFVKINKQVTEKLCMELCTFEGSAS